MSEYRLIHTQLNLFVTMRQPRSPLKRRKNGPVHATTARLGTCFALVGKKYLMSPRELHAIVERVRCEFLEMPGLRVTPPQAARLWGLDLRSCEAVIDALIRSAFLKRTSSGAVARLEQ